MRTRRIYYDIQTGETIKNTGETENPLAVTLLIEDEIQKFTELSERNRETFDVLELPFGAYTQDFAECNGYRVNVTTKTLEFSYPDPNEIVVEPVYQKPLSTQILELQQSLNLNPPVTNPITLDDYKQNKIYEINTACNQMILNGFTSSCTGTEHQYKFDMEYQGNFSQQAILLLLDSTITEVMWPTKDMGVISHSRDNFVQLCKDAQDWKATNIYRYFAMKSQVEACETIEAVNLFVW